MLTGICAGIFARAICVMAIAQEAVPPPLRDWQQWVLHGEEFRRCPFLSTNRADADECEFDSRHSGHVNFVWADGHVASVDNDVDRDFYKQSAIRR